MQKGLRVPTISGFLMGIVKNSTGLFGEETLNLIRKVRKRSMQAFKAASWPAVADRFVSLRHAFRGMPIMQSGAIVSHRLDSVNVNTQLSMT